MSRLYRHRKLSIEIEDPREIGKRNRRNFDHLFIIIDHPTTNLIITLKQALLVQLTSNQSQSLLSTKRSSSSSSKKKEDGIKDWRRINKKNKPLGRNYLPTLHGPPKNLATFMENPRDPRTADSKTRLTTSLYHRLTTSLSPGSLPVAGSHSSGLTSSFSCWPLAKIAIHHRIN